MRNILVVDDSQFNHSIVKDTLSDFFNIIPVMSGFEALEFLEKRKCDLILLDIEMPGMDGKETLKRIKENEEISNIPIMFLTSDSSSETEAECLALGADDFIPKPFVPVVMKNRILRLLELNDLRTALEKQLYIKTKQLEKVTLNSIMVIANTIDAKDKYTSGHSIRVAAYAEAIARRIGFTEKEIQNLHYIALLHDIGKIGIPDAILNKPTKLTEEEFNIIKKHTIIGSEILKDIHMIHNVEEGALYHHERYDGTGYPTGLSGNDIPLTARIVCIADSYDAMTSNRIYRPKLERDEVIREFKNSLGTQFDPEIGKIFIEMIKDGSLDNLSSQNTVSSESEGHITDESSMLLNKIIAEYTSDMKNSTELDSLTGLYNRTFIEAKVTELILSGHTGALFIVDMDNFKFVNDNHGHIVGDQTLKCFSRTILSCISKNDYAARLGGDEFVIFIDNQTDKNKLSEIATNIIQTLRNNLSEILPDNTTSVSMGIALTPTDGDDFLTLYKNADRALYYTKENGKNNFHFFRDRNSLRRNNEVFKKINADLDAVQRIIEGNIESKKGAYHVRYSDFQKIYNFISRYIDRKYSIVQIILFTLNEKNNYVIPEIINEAMIALESTIISSLRSADVTTKYSSVQHIVVLMDSNLENGKKVAERIINSFNKNYSNPNLEVSYSIKSIETKTIDRLKT